MYIISFYILNYVSLLSLSFCSKHHLQSLALNREKIEVSEFVLGVTLPLPFSHGDGDYKYRSYVA